MHWDAKKRRYVDNRGRVLSDKQVRKEVEDYVAAEQKVTETEAKKLVASMITVGGFFWFMTRKVETWHRLTGTIAYGGQLQMTVERLARIQEKIDSELEYLAGFRSDVERADQIMDSIVPRAGMYADSAYATYENNVKARETDAGVLTGRRVTEHDGNVCQGCQDASSPEYVPLADLLDIGSATCLSRCRCHVEFNYSGIEPITVDRGIYAPGFSSQPLEPSSIANPSGVQ